MFNAGFYLGFCFLLVLSIIDIYTFNKKDGYIPSVLTTSFLILSFIYMGNDNIYSGILGLLFGLLFTDLDVWGGIADYKVFIASSLLLSSLGVMVMALYVTMIGLLIKLFIKKFFPKMKVIPFIPIIFISFIITYMFF